MKSIRNYLFFEGGLILFLIIALVVHHLHVLAIEVNVVFIIVASVIGTLPVLYSSFKAIVAREISMDVLAGLALLFSLIGREWPSAIFIGLMLSAARVMTVWNAHRTEHNIESLLKLRPDHTRVRRGADVVDIAVEEVVVGDIVLVEVGGRVPIDGVVVAGGAALDESSLTGESVPVDKGSGAKVFSSTLIASGSLEIKAEKVGKETTLERMIELVQQAHKEKPDITTLAEKFGKIYIISIFILSAVLFFFTHNLLLVLAVVLVVCADDVAISVPLAYISAIGVAARYGVIIKGSSYLEEIGKAKVFIFDKTGTITKGSLYVESIAPHGAMSETDVLGYALALATRSNHPVSKAIVRHGEAQKIVLPAVETFEEVSGKGMMGTVSGKRVVIGKVDFLAEHGVVVTPEALALIEHEKRDGKTVTIVALENIVIGVIGVMDEIKTNVKETLLALKNLGVERFIMLTGDNAFVAARIAKEVGITEFHADLLPEDKLTHVKDLVKNGVTTVMVGDGVNDAAALELATIGIAMGAIGYDAAIESANIVLMRDDISTLPEIMKLSHYLHRVVIQDFWIWGSSNVVGLALVFMGIIGPTGAAAYNFLSDFLPLGNSIKVTRISFGKKEQI